MYQKCKIDFAVCSSQTFEDFIQYQLGKTSIFKHIWPQCAAGGL